MKTKKLIIIGAGETAELACEYFTYDSDYEVTGFAVERAFVTGSSFCGLQVCEFEDMEQRFSPAEYDVFVAVSFVQLNRVRAKLYHAAKAKGYTCANYISSKAFVWRNVELGENNFILENNIISSKAKLGNNITVRSGNFIGQGTVVQDHVWLTAHCVIAGACEIGAYSFIGVHSTVNDKIKIGRDNIIGSAAVVVRPTTDRQLMIGAPAKASIKSSYEAFNVTEEPMFEAEALGR